MGSDGSVTRLIRLLRSDDAAERDLAARLIWRRYFHDLLELARNHLSKRIRRREDEEDVLQSMYKSFCLRQQRGEFDLAGRDALWKLLVTITLRKARNAAKKQATEKRDIAREATLVDRDDPESAQWALEQMDATGRTLGPPFVPAPGAGTAVFSPDGKIILAWSGDESGRITSRLWDVATGEPIGPPLEQVGATGSGGDLGFSPDGRSMVTMSDWIARLWHLPRPVVDDLPRVALWVQTLTGLEVDDKGKIQALDTDAWKQRRDRLRELGGPPESDPG